jgi:hypothetical protein
MRVREVIWLPEIEDKLWNKHRIAVIEAEEVLFGEPHIRVGCKVTKKAKICTPLMGRQMQDAT